ncbi:uncharacterized protein LOC105420226 isoform X1 [Amborella trichopoda]|uniref:uncharacterized protein LOC105420226 isoform X1 n=1 Tax=Amborella trichopoda TaxID=13333 RepID=UPI0009BFB2F0|nr:uncharacterized protein LOC105420226 isoform X1 [Amborella trichopoda]|eukprot:XP_020519462.1 uncharacterized protein LOC105420226 isoform X1 [Amborella trichopoda]
MLLVTSSLCAGNKYSVFGVRFLKFQRSKRIHLTLIKSLTVCSSSATSNASFSSAIKLVDAQVLYCLAPALGHNQGIGGGGGRQFCPCLWTLQINIFHDLGNLHVMVDGFLQESHPECNSRLSAIANALDKMKLSSKLLAGSRVPPTLEHSHEQQEMTQTPPMRRGECSRGEPLAWAQWASC